MPPRFIDNMKKPRLNELIAKSKRLIQLRKLAKLSRANMAQLAEAAITTYRGWEGARFGGIPLRRAEIIVNALKADGIDCSSDWLMHGTGSQPQKIAFYQAADLRKAVLTPTTKNSPEAIERLRIKAELEFFCNNYNWDVLSLKVPDDSMEPCFLKEDLVAGIKISHKEIPNIIGQNCLVRIKSNKVLLRQIQKSNMKGLYILSCLSADTARQLILSDEEIVDIALINWIRRKNLDCS